jgi:hypothetical protein
MKNVLLSSKIFKAVREIRENGIGERIVEEVTLVEHFVHTSRFGIIGTQVEIETTLWNLWCREGESNPQGPKPGGF